MMNMHEKLNDFLQKAMRKHGHWVPARLQTALALLERVREHGSLRLDDHKKKGSTGILSHETYGHAGRIFVGWQSGTVEEAVRYLQHRVG